MFLFKLIIFLLQRDEHYFNFIGKMIPDIPPNISFNENKNSNLKVEKIEIFGIDKMEKALEITLKFVGMKNPSLEFFFNPISNECKQIDNAEIHAIGINLKIGETFKVSNLYNVNGVINNEHKNENAALIEEFNVPISIIKFRYENKWLKMLEMTVQFKKSGDYKLLLNRINDDCKTTKNSIEFEETNRKANWISKRKFSNNGFNKGFILCFQYKFSEVKGIVEKVEKTVVDAGHNIVKTISTAPSADSNEIVKGVDAVVFKGKEHLKRLEYPNEFTNIKKQEEEQQAPSKLPIKFGIEQSSEKNEEKYKKVAQIKPLFYKGFVMRRQKESVKNNEKKLFFFSLFSIHCPIPSCANKIKNCCYSLQTPAHTNKIKKLIKKMPCSSSLISNNNLTTTNYTITNNNIKILYHLGLTSENTNFREEFGDVKFVCLGGSYTRMHNYAKLFSTIYGFPISNNLCKTDRYEMYKTGPVIWANHGMGGPSMSIIMDELLQLLKCAKATNVQMFRLGTSGGVGVQPGTVIISNGAINTALEPFRYQWIGGELIKRPAILDQNLSEELFLVAQQQNFPVEKGITLCSDDFYESQYRGRDGYFCDNDNDQKMEFMNKLVKLGVKNIEMECVYFAAITYRAKIPGAICCVALVNRLEENMITKSKRIL
ncbi:PNP_UDP_1 domain-containing protein [Meloidogyne graminicola]|uniref:PNP_UDP_1 domain-containing protein n=1 Tax=Meloidogyne graminicola TaxID=189291 RepID=A0A8S9ZQ44_9BILA|nr:PNP_UDP_1 domain-containing protein [Meloidogyne graminicola]